jgi:hypothetical protein
MNVPICDMNVEDQHDHKQCHVQAVPAWRQTEPQSHGHRHQDEQRPDLPAKDFHELCAAFGGSASFMRQSAMSAGPRPPHGAAFRKSVRLVPTKEEVGPAPRGGRAPAYRVSAPKDNAADQYPLYRMVP